MAKSVDDDIKREYDTTNFDKAKTEIQALVNDSSKSVIIKKMEEKTGLFKAFDKKVTGAELNSTLVEIETVFRDMYDLHTKESKQFLAFSNMINALDDEYIKSILIAIDKSAEANKNAEKAIKKAEKAFKQYNDAQDQINQSFRETEKIVLVLKKFKERLDEIHHLDEVDELWEKANEQEKTLDDLCNNISSIHESIKENSMSIQELEKDIEDKSSNLEEEISELKDSNLFLTQIVTEKTLREKIKSYIIYGSIGASIVLGIANLILGLNGVF